MINFWFKFPQINSFQCNHKIF